MAMFYENNPHKVLRFGDVVSGFVLGHCYEYAPSLERQPSQYNVRIDVPPFSVVLTPCCTLNQQSGGIILLSPLEQIRPPLYFENSFFKEDLTRINREMTIKDAIGPEVWSGMSDDEKAKRLSESPGRQYVHFGYYVYENWR